MENLKIKMSADLRALYNYARISGSQPFLKSYVSVLSTFQGQRLHEALSLGQLESKKWACEKLKEVWGHTDPKIIFVLGGWYGILANLMIESGSFSNTKFRSFDKDDEATQIADQLNKKWVIDDWRFKAVTADIVDLDFEWTKYQTMNSKRQVVQMSEKADVIINTSCEHFSVDNLKVLLNRIPKGRKVLFQSNNFEAGSGHVNCVASLQEFLEQLSLSQILYGGELQLEKYTRYMVLGLS